MILYTLWIYDKQYDIKFNNNMFEVIFENKLTKDEIDEIKKKVNENQLRKDIATENKKIREYIIAAALWFPENNDKQTNN